MKKTTGINHEPTHARTWADAYIHTNLLHTKLQVLLNYIKSIFPTEAGLKVGF